MMRWMKPFKINLVCFDAQAKEYVRISNGICRQCQAVENHTECVFEPHEAIALRVTGVNLENNTPTVGYTYRKVEAQHLTPAAYFKMRVFFEDIQKSSWTGRI